jgi:hypothetical protein
VQVFADAFFEPFQRGNERFGHVAAAEGAEASVGVREFAGDGIGEQALTVDWGGCHGFSSYRLTERAAATKRAISA